MWYNILFLSRESCYPLKTYACNAPVSVPREKSGARRNADPCSRQFATTGRIPWTWEIVRLPVAFRRPVHTKSCARNGPPGRASGCGHQAGFSTEEQRADTLSLLTDDVPLPASLWGGRDDGPLLGWGPGRRGWDSSPGPASHPAGLGSRRALPCVLTSFHPQGHLLLGTSAAAFENDC